MVAHSVVVNCRARHCLCSITIPLLLLATIGPAVGEVNSWTKPTSGYWEEQAYWSLGVLPDATQNIEFNNAGWKALAIGAQTAQNFPQSMQVGVLTVAAPADSYNTLLMNFSGFERPLQTTSLLVYSNSSMVVLSSALEVSGNAFLGGTFIQSDYSYVKVDGDLSVGRFGGGTYFLTNGTLVARGLYMGAGMSYGLGRFAQYGGSNNVGALQVEIQGELDVYGGEVNATNGITVGDGDWAALSSFYQYGGNVNADTFVNGNYILNGGTITGQMSVPSSTEYHRADASVLQTGGTNLAVSMSLGAPNRYGGMAFYTLSNGVIRVASSTTFRGGQFSQYNGVHTIVSNFVVQGTDIGMGFASANYFLGGGTFSAGSILAEAGGFRQDGGTNSITGDLVLSTAPPSFGGYIREGYYNLGAGFLSANNISISNGAAFGHSGGVINHSGVLTLAGGNWNARPGAQALGPLRLALGSLTNYWLNPTNSAIGFPADASVLRLANSSGQPWDSSAVLFINGWHGSITGGGESQLFFGSNANGLTSQQLTRIKFSLPGGIYPARLLATGEVVPQAHLLTFSRSGNTVTLTWEPGWTLQSSTNVAGPYQDVQGAASSYAISMSNPNEFFRVRQ